MDEIALLQQQLAAVQQQESALKLSDHNVIDLLAKLQQLSKIQIIHTLTAKQILTPQQVEREIQDYVTLNAGRVSISELSQLMNIDRSYVEKYVGVLVKNRNKSSSFSTDNSKYYVVNNGEEVITNWYLDAIMEDTNTLLQENGTMTIGELAQQYSFDVEYMKNVVLARLGSILQAQEKSNVLYTDSFVESQKAQIRGVFSAITRPTFIPEIIRNYRFEDKVVEELLTELIQQHVLMGTLRGREYVPYVFIEAQKESMYSFFQQNGYLDHARAQQLQVTRPYDFLKKRFPDSIPLKDCVVSHALQLQVEGSIDVAINDASFVDLRNILPSAIQAVDIGLLLAKSPFIADKQVFQIVEVYAVSSTFLTKSLEKFKQDAVVKAKAAASEQKYAVNMSAAAFTQKESRVMDDFSDDEDDGSRKGKKGKRSKAFKNAPSPPPVEEEVTNGKSKKGGKKNKKEKNSGTCSTGSKNQNTSSSNSFNTIVPSREEKFELLSSWFDQIEGDEELLEGLIDHKETEIDHVYSEQLSLALSSILRGDTANLRDLIKKFEDQFDEAYSLLVVIEKGFQKLEHHVDDTKENLVEKLTLIETNILDTLCVDLSSLATSFINESNSLDMKGVSPFTAPEGDKDATNSVTLNSLSDANKKILERNVSQSMASAVVRLWTLSTAGRRSLGDFMVHLPIFAEAMNMPLRKMDRKKERQIIFNYRHQTIGQLEQCNGDKNAQVGLLLQLFFQQTTGFPMRFPLHDIAFADVVLEAFRSSTPEEAMQKFEEMLTAARGQDDASELFGQVQALVTAKSL